MTSYLLFQESPKISQQWREPKPEGNLTHHQYMPPEPRQGSRTDPQTERSALAPPGSPLWEGTNSQQPPPRYDLHFCSSRSPSPQHPPPSNSESKIRGVQSGTPSSLRTQDSRPPAPLPSVPKSPGLKPKSRSPEFLFSHAQELASCRCALGDLQSWVLTFLHLQEPPSLRNPECLFSLCPF